jgi:hypothetical protein
MGVLRGVCGRKVHGAAPAQHVGDQCTDGGAVDHYRRRKVGGDQHRCRSREFRRRQCAWKNSGARPLSATAGRCPMPQISWPSFLISRAPRRPSRVGEVNRPRRPGQRGVARGATWQGGVAAAVPFADDAAGCHEADCVVGRREELRTRKQGRWVAFMPAPRPMTRRLICGLPAIRKSLT